MTFDDSLFEETDADKAIRLQNGLIARACGGGFDGGDPVYKELRTYFATRADTRDKLPNFIRRCSDVAQFWGYIQPAAPTYAGRREILWVGFRPLIEYLEGQDRAPGVAPITAILQGFDPDTVHAAWQKALDRRAADPDGAITAARALLETVCKHILDDQQITYPEDADLPKLWHMTAASLNLAPHQHQEPIFKTILGNCQSVVNSLGSIRNKVGDAHGQGRRPIKPKPRHAELAVNLAGTMASFLVATWKDRAG